MTEAAGLEPANGRDRLRVSNALPCQLGHASRSTRKAEGEGVEPPRPGGPPVFETGYRARWQSFRASGSGRSRTCTSPGKSRELCRIELRSQECDRQESNLRRPAFQAGALPTELRSREGRARGEAATWPRSGRLQGSSRLAIATRRLPALRTKWARLDSNQLPLVCKTSAHPDELLAREYPGRESNPHGRRPRRSRRRASTVPPPGCELRDKGSNLDLRVQSAVSYRLDDPGPVMRLRPSL